jgi:uncharacterized protein YndB with AHSA1/START domain
MPIGGHMTLQSSETPLVPPTPRALDEGPVLERAPHGTELADQTLRIRARRLLPISGEEAFGAWTRRTAWDSWMRLRARSRASLAPYRGGAFRLELAEGPTIHVITGTVNDIRPHELLSLTWIRHNSPDQGSTVDVAFRQHHGETELTLTHRGIASRREAAWLMRFWTAVLGRLADYLREAPASRRTRDLRAKIPTSTEPEMRRTEAIGRFARSAGLAFAVATLANADAAAQPAPDSAQAASVYVSAQRSDAHAGLGARDSVIARENWLSVGPGGGGTRWSFQGGVMHVERPLPGSGTTPRARGA